MAEEVKITFKVAGEMADWIGKVAFDLDRTKSEIIRCCILLGVDTIKATPSLVDRIQFADRCQ